MTYTYIVVKDSSMNADEVFEAFINTQAMLAPLLPVKVRVQRFWDAKTLSTTIVFEVLGDVKK